MYRLHPRHASAAQLTANSPCRLIYTSVQCIACERGRLHVENGTADIEGLGGNRCGKLVLLCERSGYRACAGWPAHRSKEESLNTIRHVLNGKERYAICERGSNNPIGSIELKLNGHTDMTDRDDECELGYWLGKPFWGRGYMPEAAKEVIRHGFVDLGMSAIWCGYYDGNLKSKRVQEKVGFVYHTRVMRCRCLLCTRCVSGT